MNQILMAAARGVRIQALLCGVWYEAAVHNLHNEKRTLRIHPDDDAFRFGPISSALREAASAGNAWDLTGDVGRMAAAIADVHEFNWCFAGELHRSLFLLLLSECLAEEGL